MSAVTYGQTYPEKPVRVIVSYAPGGNADTLARIISQRLAHALEQAFVVENRAGANGVIGTEIAAKAVPDGYTLLFMSSGHTASGYRWGNRGTVRLELMPVHELMGMLAV